MGHESEYERTSDLTRCPAERTLIWPRLGQRHSSKIRGARALSATVAVGVILALSGGCSGSGSKTEGRIAFIGAVWEGDERSYDVYVVNADGTGRKRLTHDDAVGGPHPGWDFMPLSPPSWSPDGKWIAFENRDTPAGEQGELAIVRADGTGRRLLVKNASLPAWSPKGDLIAFSRDRQPSSDVWTIRPDGTGARVLVRSAYSNAWSPDGARIAFSRIREHSSAIYVASAQGSDESRLTTSPQVDVFPAWGPANRIAFLRLTDGEPAEAELFTIDPDGTNLQRLARLGNLAFQAWSPDGSRIASSAGGLIVMKADGTGSDRITTGLDDQAPVWEPTHG